MEGSYRFQSISENLYIPELLKAYRRVMLDGINNDFATVFLHAALDLIGGQSGVLFLTNKQENSKIYVQASLGYNDKDVERLKSIIEDMAPNMHIRKENLNKDNNFIRNVYIETIGGKNKQLGYIVFAKDSTYYLERKHLLKEFFQVAGALLEEKSIENIEKYHSKEFSALFDINKFIRYSVKLNDVIAKVIEKVTHLLDAERAGVLLYDEENNELVLQKPAFGIEDDRAIAAYRVSLKEGGNAVNVFLTGEPYVSNDSARDQRMLQKYVQLFGAKNTITVPLKVDNRCIGVMHVDNKRTGSFIKEDLKILMLLASHLAVLIENSALFEREKKQTEKVYKLNKDLQVQQDKLKKMLDIHGKLVRMVLNEEGLEAIVLMLAKLIKSPVIILDDKYKLLCSSESLNESSHALGTFLENNSHMKKKLNEGQIIKFNQSADCGREQIRVVAPIGGKNDIMAYLSILTNSDAAYDDLDMVAIEEGAMVIALEMMKGKIKLEVETRYRTDFLDDLFSNRYEDEKSILQRAEFFGYSLMKKSRVVIFLINYTQEDVKSGGTLSASVHINHQNSVISLANQLLPGSFAVGKGNSIVVLVPTTKVSEKYLTQKLNETCKFAKGRILEGNVIVGVGKECECLEDYKESYEQALKALSAVRYKKDTEVIYYEQLGVYKLLFEIKDRAILEKFVEARIGCLLRYDDKNNVPIIETLEHYLQTGKSLKETAQALYIHIGTVKYRLRRVQEILGIDLQDEESLFELKLALHINRMLGEKK